MADNFPDLILTDNSKPLEQNKNDYFLVTITNLIPGKTYPVEFRWNYKDPSQKGDWGAVLNITTPTYAPSGVSSIVPAWSGSNFTLSFTHNPSASANANLSYYKITLTSSAGTVDIRHPFKAGTSNQFFTVPVNKSSSPFNTAVNAISGSITAVDKDNNESVPVSFPLTTRTSSLSVPVITATAINNGYSISYTTPTAQEYDHIEIEEVESSSLTDPGTGYSSSFIGIANPAAVTVSSLNKRWVRAKFWDNGGLATAYSTAVSVTPTTPITIDTTPPAAPASGSVTAGIDTSSGSTVGFNAYIDISWTAVSDSTLKGYRIRFRKSGSSDPYGYVDSPGTGTSFRLNGLSIGVTYEIAIASYDEFNNTTGTYTSLGTASAGGTPYIGKNVSTTGYFEAAPSGETGAFRFGYGVQPGYRGLTFNANNYWYIDSNASASFKLGGSTQNYISWDGNTFIVDGNIRAKGGYFYGNVEVQSGAGLYSGTIVSNNLTSDGFILNTSGLLIKKGSISLRLDTSDGGIYAQKGTIGNWTIDTTAIVSSSGNVPKITLNSSTQQIVASSNTYSAGIAIPEADSGSAIVFWAGQSGRSTSSKFYVTADGNINSSGGTIGGWTIGSATLTGGLTALNSNGTISGATITGAIITTTGGNSYGAVRMNTNTDAFEFLYSGSVVGSLYTFNAGSEILIQKGSPTSLGYAINTGFISIYSTGLSLGRTNASGILTTGFNIDGSSPSITALAGGGGFIVSGGPIYTGTNTTTATDQSEGISLTQGGTLSARRSGGNPLNLHRFNVSAGSTTSVSVIDFYRNATARGSLEIFGNTSAPVLVGSSDYRLKENIRDYSGGLDKILAAKVRVFNEIEDPLHNDIVGFVAHEFAEVFPNFVNGEKDAVDEDGSPIYQGLSYSNIIPYLVNAIQTLSKRLDELEG